MNFLKSGILALLTVAALGGCVKDRIDEGAGEQNPVSRKIAREEVAEEGVLLVKLSAEVADGAMEATRSGATRSGIEPFDVALDEIHAGTLEPLFVITEQDDADSRAFGLHRWYTVRFDEALSLDTAAKRLAQVNEVSLVQYNGQIVKNFSGQHTLLEEAASATRAMGDFNDPRLNLQWHYKNTGDTSIVTPIKAGADINLEPAWELCAGDPSILVAVMDEGVAYSHEDLADNMWVNEAELNGTQGRDDDGNGYVDDIYGYNFASNRGQITWNQRDDDGHGTHVAGTVSAVNNNGLGVCGVAGGTGKKDGVKLISIQIFSGSNGVGQSASANAIKYAADRGASILQCSFGAASGAVKSDEEYLADTRLETDAYNYFINKSRPGSPLNGGIICFSAGNNGSVCCYPAAYHTMICVTAFAADYTPSTFTNFGDRADIAAPGGDTNYYDYANNAPERGAVLSTLPPAQGEGTYGYMSGTSMSTPHVSGVAALGLSYAKKLGKTFTPDEFRSLLLGAVNDLDPHLTGNKTFRSYIDEQEFSHQSPMNMADYKNKMGSGMVDAYKMLMAVRGTPAITVGVGEEVTVSLAKYYGDITSTMVYAFSVSDEVREKLGLTYTVVDDYTVKIKCMNQTAGLAAVVSEVGQTPLSREVAIICRAKEASNGGWL